MEQLVEEDKFEMLKFELHAVLANERRRALKQVLTEPIMYFKLESFKRARTENLSKSIFKNTKDYVLCSYCLYRLLMTDYADNGAFNRNYFGKRNPTAIIFQLFCKIRK